MARCPQRWVMRCPCDATSQRSSSAICNTILKVFAVVSITWMASERGATPLQGTRHVTGLPFSSISKNAKRLEMQNDSQRRRRPH